MSDSGDAALVLRLAAIEAELALMRNDLRMQGIALRTSDADSRAARTLAAGADRDVSELRELMNAHTRALNALRTTQIELYAKHDADITEVKAGLGQIVGMLGRLIDDDDREPPHDAT